MPYSVLQYTQIHNILYIHNSSCLSNCTQKDRLEYNYYSVKSNMLSFRVKASNDVHVILSSTQYDSCPCHEIFFGGWQNTKSVIRKNRQKPDLVEVQTPNILNPFEYKGFWIRWDHGVLMAGVQGSTTPILTYYDSHTFPIRYFGLCTGWGARGHWIVDTVLPANNSYNAVAPYSGISHPPQPQPSFNPAFVFCYSHSPANAPQWISASYGHIPLNAVIGGYDVDGESMYIIRARHKGSLTPGKLSRKHGKAFVPWGGNENSKFEYEVLCNCTPQWVNVDEGHVPQGLGAYVAGYTECGESLYVGRVYYKGSLTPGKVQPSHETCYISFGGKEIAEQSYQILVLGPDNQSNSPKWIASSNGCVPARAVVGGRDINGEPLYVIRAHHEGSLTPGKLPQSYGKAFVAWGGRENGKYEYEVLCKCTPRWLKVSKGIVPPNALAAGYTENKETLYIGRVNHKGSTTIGKVQPSHRVCYISFGGHEIANDSYEILTL